MNYFSTFAQSNWNYKNLTAKRWLSNLNATKNFARFTFWNLCNFVVETWLYLFGIIVLKHENKQSLKRMVLFFFRSTLFANNSPAYCLFFFFFWGGGGLGGGYWMKNNSGILFLREKNFLFFPIMRMEKFISLKSQVSITLY